MSRSRTTIAVMRGDDRQPDSMFSYVSPEQRVPSDHPLRAIRALVDGVCLSPQAYPVNITCLLFPEWASSAVGSAHEWHS